MRTELSWTLRRLLKLPNDDVLIAGLRLPKGKDKAVDDLETGELGEGHEDKDNDGADADDRDLGDDGDSVEL